MPAVIPTRYLEVGGVPLSIDGAWRVTDYTPLLAEADQRGEDVLVPYQDGRKAKRRWRDSAKVAVPMVIFGKNDENGDLHADEVDGLEANIAFLNDNVVAPVASGDGTRAATLHLPGGARTASVHILGLELARLSPIAARGSLALSIPAGRFV